MAQECYTSCKEFILSFLIFPCRISQLKHYECAARQHTKSPHQSSGPLDMAPSTLLRSEVFHERSKRRCRRRGQKESRSRILTQQGRQEPGTEPRSLGFWVKFRSKSSYHSTSGEWGPSPQWLETLLVASFISLTLNPVFRVRLVVETRTGTSLRWLSWLGLELESPPTPQYFTI